MIKFLKLTGIIFSIFFVYSIIFWSFADKSIPFFNDMGVLEAFILLVAMTTFEFVGIIVSFIIFLILFFLRKRKTIIIDNNLLFVIGFIVLVLFNSFFYLFFISKNLAVIDVESITKILFVPLIHSIIFYNFTRFIIERNNKHSKKK
jgi:ABC-type Mn2+/Zn2+ transport system permease subunit